MINFLCEGEATNQTGNIFIYVILIVVLIAMLIVPYISQRRKTKEYEAMINSINVGDLVKTAGGIIGRVKSISDKGEIKTIILETGSKNEKSYMEFDMSMIYCVLKSTKATETQSEEKQSESISEETQGQDGENENESLTSEEPEKNENSKLENLTESIEANSELEDTSEEPKEEEKKQTKKSTSRKSSVKSKKRTNS